MRVQTEEWRRFIPGVRMYKGKMTLFWNGEKLRDDAGEYLVYNVEERHWQVIIVLPGVEVIPHITFLCCHNVETVIMSDSVKRIEDQAFYECDSLKFVRLSKTLEYIGDDAFYCCDSLTSIFIPDSCREIGDKVFYDCFELIILSVPRHTQLGGNVVDGDTALSKASPLQLYEDEFYYSTMDNDEVNEWIKNVNQAEEFALHRECASIEPPSEDNIYEIIQQRGLPSIHVKNEIGLTALEYLQKNPYAAENQIDQHKLIKRLVLDLMGENHCLI